jgi:hypothetical protein
MATHFNLPQNSIQTYSCSHGNAITKTYYDFLVGEINRGIIYKAVCRIEDKRFNSVSYYLISER